VAGTQRPNYSVFVSELVLSEACKGHPEAAQRRLAAIGALPLLQISLEVRILAQALIEDHALPVKAEADAYHVAIAVLNGIKYLLTWNCTHIANAHTRPKIEATCRAHGYEPPIICTPTGTYRGINMWKDPIVTETRALRDEYARQFNYDADAIFEDLMAKQATHLERVVSLPPRKVSVSTEKNPSLTQRSRGLR
jgi:hypothetical protein